MAADGVGSRLRGALGSAVHATGLVAWRAVLPADGVDVAAVAGEAWGRGGLFGAAALTGGRLYWFASYRAPASADGSAAEERELLLERFAGWHDPIPAIIEATAPDAIIRTPLLELPPLPTWTSGRVALLGTPPTPCCRTSAKEAARRSRTRRHSAKSLGTAPRCRKRFAPTSTRASREPTTSPASRDG